MQIVIPSDIEAAGPDVVEFYTHLIVNQGQSHSIAEMCALRSPPRCMTDSVFFSDQGTLQKQFGKRERELNYITKKAIESGYKPNCNDVYNPALAKFPGDPKAFIPATGGRGHVQAVCNERGWSCDGAVKVSGRAPETDPHTPKHKLHPSIVQRRYKQMVKQDPGVVHRDKGEVCAEIIAKHGSE